MHSSTPIETHRVAPGDPYTASSTTEAIGVLRSPDSSRPAVQVVLLDMTTDLSTAYEQTDIRPAGAYEHLLTAPNQEAVSRLTAQFGGAVRRREYKRALRALKQMSKHAPGLSSTDMLNHYCSDLHLALQRDQRIKRLFVELYGEDFVRLPDRAAFRCSTGSLTVGEARFHKEGDGTVTVLVCFPGTRYFAAMPYEGRCPLAPPGETGFRMVRPEECTDPEGAHRPVSLRIDIPDGQVALVMFKQSCVHGIDPRGSGLQVFLAACARRELAEYERKWRLVLGRGTHRASHDPRTRQGDALSFEQTVLVSALVEGPPVLWSSGKVVPGNGVHSRSVKANARKFRDDDVQFRYQDDDVQDVSERQLKRQRLREYNFPESHVEWLSGLRWRRNWLEAATQYRP